MQARRSITKPRAMATGHPTPCCGDATRPTCRSSSIPVQSVAHERRPVLPRTNGRCHGLTCGAGSKHEGQRHGLGIVESHRTGWSLAARMTTQTARRRGRSVDRQRCGGGPLRGHLDGIRRPDTARHARRQRTQSGSVAGRLKADGCEVMGGDDGAGFQHGGRDSERGRGRFGSGRDNATRPQRDQQKRSVQDSANPAVRTGPMNPMVGWSRQRHQPHGSPAEVNLVETALDACEALNTQTLFLPSSLAW